MSISGESGFWNVPDMGLSFEKSLKEVRIFLIPCAHRNLTFLIASVYPHKKQKSLMNSFFDGRFESCVGSCTRGVEIMTRHESACSWKAVLEKDIRQQVHA